MMTGMHNFLSLKRAKIRRVPLQTRPRSQKGEENVTKESKGISKEGRRKDEEVFRL